MVSGRAIMPRCESSLVLSLSLAWLWQRDLLGRARAGCQWGSPTFKVRTVPVEDRTPIISDDKGTVLVTARLYHRTLVSNGGGGREGLGVAGVFTGIERDSR